MTNRTLSSMALLVVLCAARPEAQPAARPFGTLREQAAMQQVWLQKRLDTFLPAIMRKHGVDLWVVPMREYNEDPVFVAVTAPESLLGYESASVRFLGKPASEVVAGALLGGAR